MESPSPERTVHLATRNHLLITQTLMVRGTVWPLGTRLAEGLSSAEERFVEILEATVTPLGGGPTREISRVNLTLETLVCAHEYVNTAGDLHLRRVHQTPRPFPAEVHLSAPAGLILHGLLNEEVVIAAPRLVVLERPRAEAVGTVAEACAAALAGLPYVLVNRRLIEALILGGEARSET
jgi:hypothetical protein